MWENYKEIRVGRDHKIVFPRINAANVLKPKAGDAWLVPLYFKRNLLLDESDLLYAWTVCHGSSLDDWAINHEDQPSLRFEIRIKSHVGSPPGHYLTIPKELREKGWLPKAGGTVLCEFGSDELNIWTPRAYNLETVRNAGS
jgi:hypothetical protein